MAKREREWVWVKPLTAEQRQDIAAICDRFIAEVLKPRFLPEICYAPHNYPVDIFGRWRGSKYSFTTRYRSGFPENAGEEFDAAFTRLDHIERSITETRFDIMWHRHTGQWWRVHSSVTLEQALHLIATEPVLQPHI